MECNTVNKVLIMGVLSYHGDLAVLEVSSMQQQRRRWCPILTCQRRSAGRFEETGQVLVSQSNSAPSYCYRVCAQRRKKKPRIICPLRLVSNILCSLRPGGSPCLCQPLPPFRLDLFYARRADFYAAVKEGISTIWRV